MSLWAQQRAPVSPLTVPLTSCCAQTCLVLSLLTPLPLAGSSQVLCSPQPSLTPPWAAPLEDFVTLSALFPLHLLWPLAHWAVVFASLFSLQNMSLLMAGTFLYISVFPAPSIRRVWCLEKTQVVLSWIEIL